MKLIHFTDSPFILDKEKEYSLTQEWKHHKPHGLWVSNEEEYGWKVWSEDNEFNLERLEHQTEIILNPINNILIINNIKNLRKFSEKFATDKTTLKECGYIWVDWLKVKPLYDGIIITPYQWKCRLDPDVFWYYSWDCASGCIWNLNAIETTKELK